MSSDQIVAKGPPGLPGAPVSVDKRDGRMGGGIVDENRLLCLESKLSSARVTDKMSLA